ncbi:unnamed protein product [Vicia faba]|uniref:Uncharacterized protein n=1 Tax=Vicia faba TaxID=3906 RepID=A0AAV1AW98_VICFA|nr:unnamed protein product [Vicia faba]
MESINLEEVDEQKQRQECCLYEEREVSIGSDWVKQFLDMSDEELFEVVTSTEVNKPNGDDEEDDDCVILEGDPEKKVMLVNDSPNGSDELLVVGEKGQIACRDYPHPRHLCATFPYDSTPHDRYCAQCHCYVCDSPAPCLKWGNGLLTTDHCHATDKSATWKILRKESNLVKTDPLPASTNNATLGDLVNSQDTHILPYDIKRLSVNSMSVNLKSRAMALRMRPVNLTLQNQTSRPSLINLTPQNQTSRPRPVNLTPQNQASRRSLINLTPQNQTSRPRPPSKSHSSKSGLSSAPSKSHSKSSLSSAPSKSHSKSSLSSAPSKSHSKSGLLSAPSKSHSKSGLSSAPSKSHSISGLSSESNKSHSSKSGLSSAYSKSHSKSCLSSASSKSHSSKSGPQNQVSRPRAVNLTPQNQASRPRPINLTPQNQASRPRPINLTPQNQASRPRPINLTPQNPASRPRPINLTPQYQVSRPPPVNLTPQNEVSHPRPVNLTPQNQTFRPTNMNTGSSQRSRLQNQALRSNKMHPLSVNLIPQNQASQQITVNAINAFARSNETHPLSENLVPQNAFSSLTSRLQNQISTSNNVLGHSTGSSFAVPNGANDGSYHEPGSPLVTNKYPSHAASRMSLGVRSHVIQKKSGHRIGIGNTPATNSVTPLDASGLINRVNPQHGDTNHAANADGYYDIWANDYVARLNKNEHQIGIENKTVINRGATVQNVFQQKPDGGIENEDFLAKDSNTNGNISYVENLVSKDKESNTPFSGNAHLSLDEIKHWLLDSN